MVKFDRTAEAKLTLYNGTTNPVSDLLIKNLRISFQINKSASWSTNTASVQIYNLSDKKRSQIKDYGDDLKLSAGYAQETGNNLLFFGSTTRVSTIFSQPDIMTNIICGDGERVINNRLITISFQEGITAREALRQLAQQVGLNIAFFAETEDKPYFQGRPFVGMAKDLIDSIAKYLGLTWSVQNGDLYLVDLNTNRPPITISQNTGMVGVPERYTYKKLDLWTGGTKQGYKVRTLLRPDILPLDNIRLISKKLNVNQLFWVYSINHAGDNYGNDWYSTFELVEL